MSGSAAPAPAWNVFMIDHPHRRFNPLRQEWVLVSPQRNDRPWHGQIDPPPRGAAVAHDPQCYLCPGNERAGGVRNPQYTSTLVFDNDFPALSRRSTREAEAAGPKADAEAENLLLAGPERGICLVICFSPRHDLTLSRMDPASIRAVVDVWIDECAAVAEQAWVKYALVFENRGDMMGASNPHPHGQLWAT